MFVVSSITQMASYQPAGKFSIANGTQHRAFAECFSDEELEDELGALHLRAISPVPAVSLTPKKASTCSVDSYGSNCSVGGGLRRLVSSMHGSYHNGMAGSIQASSSVYFHASPSSCIVEAKQVEMDFVNLSANQSPFQLAVTAPNGESSIMLFDHYGQSHRFCPTKDGCGHGNWAFAIHEVGAADSRPATAVKQENIYLDGVGSLFFTIDDNMNVRLSSQEFLRLPSASKCCVKSKH